METLMSQFKIDEVLPSKSGKAWRVRTGQTWYNAFGDSGIEGHVGKVIDAEIKTHDTYGAGIQKYKVVGLDVIKALETVQNAPRATNEVTVAPYWQAFVSNQVANAIAAGLIKEPGQIKEWTFAAMNAIKGAVEGDISF